MSTFRKLSVAVALCLPLAAAAQTPGGIKFKVSGDFNNRAMIFTDQASIYRGAETIASGETVLSEDTLEEAWVDFKYRLTFEAATEGDAAKGVFGLELGAVRFGDASRGGGFSGDGNNYETRLAYVDFGLPMAPGSRLSIGLQPFLVNKYLWSETATGIQWKGDVGPTNLTLAWMRGREIFTSSTEQEVFADGDNLLARLNLVPQKDLKIGAFFLYQRQNPDAAAAPGTTGDISYLLKRFGSATTYDIGNVGVDGSLNFGNIFVNFDAIYQMGTVSEFGAPSQDLSAFFAHADVGVNLGALKLTYTGWYASGDDDAADGDINNFIATDVDTFDSIVLFEGGYTDDNYFTEAPYFLTFGAIFNKVALDFAVSPKVNVGAALMYIMTAEDVTLADGSNENVIGTEIDGYISYKPVKQLELAVNAGYLIAGDAMDAFEVGPRAGNGSADADIFRATARARYIF